MGAVVRGPGEWTILSVGCPAHGARRDRLGHLPLPAARARCRARGIHEVSLYVHWSGDDQPARARSLTTTRTTSGCVPPRTCRPPRSRRSATSSPCTSRCWRRVTTSCRSTSPAACRAPCARPSRPASSSARRAERVHVIDSATACGGEGLILLAAAAAAEAGGDGGGRRRPGPPGARGPEDVVRDRHARVPAARWPDRRRSGVAGLGAEDQADPHGRVRDHADRARAHVRPRVRAHGRSTAIACRTTAPTRGWSSTSRRPIRRGSSPARHARSSAANRCVDLPDRPRDRDPCGTGFARCRRDSGLFV